jgi:hypothetical protein
MIHIEMFENFIQKYSPKEVCDYIREITPHGDDVPEFFLEKIMKSRKLFHIRVVHIEELLKSDPDLKEYIDSEDKRYDDDDVDPNDMGNPVVILNGEVLDGYSRISELLRKGDNEVTAYIA